MGFLTKAKEFVRPYYLKWFYFNLKVDNCPPCFSRWRGYSTLPIGRDTSALIPLETGLVDFIFLPMADWHGITQRSQQFARALASRGHRSVYINPHLGREFAQPYPFSPRHVVSWVEPRVIELHTHLPFEPVFHQRLLTRQETGSLVRGVSTVLNSMGSVHSVSLISFPLWTDVALRLKESRDVPIIYDCHDLLEGFDDISEDILEKESELFRVADLVIFSSELLATKHLERAPELASKSIIARNAVDASTFTGAYEEPRANPRPVIGYVGSLNSWFDVEAVTLAAREHPEWQVELVGIMADAFPREIFAAYPNVHLTGEVPYCDVPKALAGMDVVMIPFRINPLTLATNPIKLYEYFASGRPIVSSALPEVALYSDIVYLATGPEQFVRQLEAAVADHDRSQRRLRRQIAVHESWQSRAEVLSVRAAELAGIFPRRVAASPSGD